MSATGSIPARARGGGLAATVAACAVSLGALPSAETAAAQGGGPHVLVASTGNNSELRKTVPITRKQGKRPRVVMSMGPGQLPSLTGGDRLQVASEVEVTTDCAKRMPRCVGRPYEYNPIVRASLVLANGQFVTGGEGSLELGSQRLRCRQKAPDREHHCVIVFPNTSLDVAGLGQLPCSPGSCHVNMVIGAHNKRKTKGKKGRRNKLLIGEDEPDASVKGDRGRINVIRFAPGDQPTPSPVVTSTALVPSIPIRKGEATVVYSQELTGLEKDDQVFVGGTIFNDISSLSYNVRIKARMVLAPSPTATGPGRKVKRITEPTGEITEGTGFNCTHRRPRCASTKVGVITMTRDAQDGGEPIPLYANLTLDSARPGGTAKASDVLPIVAGGQLAVMRFPAAVRG